MSAGFLALLDDVAAIMAKAAANTKVVAGTIDDIAAMAGAGAKGASAIVIDDIPVNAKAMTEFTIDAKREIPIVKAIERGSLINKCVAVPLALLVNSFAPFLLTPILALGGAYLGYEGAEKVLHSIKEKLGFHGHEEGQKETAESQEAFERNLIKGAIKTDMVMSVEIIFIALASIKDSLPDAAWYTVLVALSVVGYVLTRAIYSLVIGLVRLDDIALHLASSAKENKVGTLKRKTAKVIIQVSPIIMKAMSIIGAAAMLYISGELLGLQFTILQDIAHFFEPPVLVGLAHMVVYGILGLIIGSAFVGLHAVVMKVIKGKAGH